MGDRVGRLRLNCGCCFIVPPHVLRAHSRDPGLDARVRAKLQETFVETTRLKQVREASRVGAMLQKGAMAPEALAAPAIAQQRLFDCEHRPSLPGAPVSNPAASADAAIKKVFEVTGKVAEFYKTVLQRNSVDNQGFDLVSSVHYRVNFDNAFWNGQQMVYGDGDGQLFNEFYNSPDVIGHELTHGVTQNESGLRYEGESGALNESISDVFGAVFNQWYNDWPASNTDGWLIGAGIIAGPAREKGKTCLRDMVAPAADHCLSPQPDSYDNFDPAADVHENSGIPNRAFALFARAVGGNSWDPAISVWYRACTSRQLSSTASIADFARLTIDVAASNNLDAQVQQAWQTVGVPLGTG
jgi:Zn-dependent metalloprotease